AAEPRNVEITVSPLPDPPITQPDLYSSLAPDFRRFGGVLANDSDPDGGGIAARLDAAPQFGSVLVQPDGTFTYTLTGGPGFLGVDQFTYLATDGVLDSVPTLVRIGRYEISTVDDFYAPTPGAPLTVNNVNGVLANDTDPNLGRFPNSKLLAT